MGEPPRGNRSRPELQTYLIAAGNLVITQALLHIAREAASESPPAE
jgi:hypothetical protein